MIQISLKKTSYDARISVENFMIKREFHDRIEFQM